MLLSIMSLIISCFLLAAHFLRNGNLVLTVLCVSTPLLLLIKRRWILIILQSFTYAGGIIWINTAVIVAQNRINMALPWNKPVFILGAVALFIIISGLLLNLRIVKNNYSITNTNNNLI